MNDKLLKIKISGGYLRVPTHWLSLKNATPDDAPFAGVIQVRGDTHAFYFLSTKPVASYSPEQQAHIEEALRDQYPALADLIWSDGNKTTVGLWEIAQEGTVGAGFFDGALIVKT